MARLGRIVVKAASVMNRHLTAVFIAKRSCDHRPHCAVFDVNVSGEFDGFINLQAAVALLHQFRVAAERLAVGGKPSIKRVGNP